VGVEDGLPVAEKHHLKRFPAFWSPSIARTTQSSPITNAQKLCLTGGVQGGVLGNRTKEAFYQHDDWPASVGSCGGPYWGLFGVRGTNPRSVTGLKSPEMARPPHNSD